MYAQAPPRGRVLGSATALLLAFAADGRSQNFRRARGRNEAHAALPRVARARTTTRYPDKVALGRLLFWDPILSGHNDVACATCITRSSGMRRIAICRSASTALEWARGAVSRRAILFRSSSGTARPFSTLTNRIDEAGGHDPAAAPMFWDVRARGLEAQALEPLKAFEEMRGEAYPEDNAIEAVVAELNANAEYRQLFARAFGGREAITGAAVGKALAAFQRSLTATNAPFDRYMRGDRTAMTDAQLRGMERFERIGCGNCHSGPMFSDYKLHVLGCPTIPNSRRPIRASTDRMPFARHRCATSRTPLPTCTAASSRRCAMCSSSMTTSRDDGPGAEWIRQPGSSTRSCGNFEIPTIGLAI